MLPESSKIMQDSPNTSGRESVLWLVMAGILATGIVFAGMFAWKKKKEQNARG